MIKLFMWLYIYSGMIVVILMLSFNDYIKETTRKHGWLAGIGGTLAITFLWLPACIIGIAKGAMKR